MCCAAGAALAREARVDAACGRGHKSMNRNYHGLLPGNAGGRLRIQKRSVPSCDWKCSVRCRRVQMVVGKKFGRDRLCSGA